MIYFSNIFSNYEEFKELFGVQEHGNGNKSRRNKILLSLLKSRELLHMMASSKEMYECKHICGIRDVPGEKEKVVWYDRCFCNISRPLNTEWLNIKDMTGLYAAVLGAIRNNSIIMDVFANDLCAESGKYRTDDFKGLCEDGDSRSIRYVNIERERVFKMKAGKFLRNIIEEHTELDALLPEQVKIWVCEEFAERWKAYAAAQVGDEYKLVIDDDFESIYDSDCCKGNFGSCMVNDGYWTFYRDAVKAKAASLRNKCGRIVARCIIYTDVHDSDGRILRLAERQYASDGDETLKRRLVMALINAGEIDGYKRVGADCHSPRAFVDNSGNALANCDLWIHCFLEPGDTVSYQDSFKWFDYDGQFAFNYDDGDCLDLAITEGRLYENHDHECWSEYHQEWIDEDDAYYVASREDYFYGNETVYAHVLYNGRYNQEECFEDDCIRIGSEYYYAGCNAEEPGEYGICECPICGDYFIYEDGCYSEVTEEDYCCSYCLEKAEQSYKEDYWYYSEYDDEYYEYSGEIRHVMQWNVFTCRYEETTIHEDTLCSLFEDGEAVEIEGVVYIDDIGFDGEPVHFCAANLCAA